jgi:hypothetical protein
MLTLAQVEQLSRSRLATSDTEITKTKGKESTMVKFAGLSSQTIFHHVGMLHRTCKYHGRRLFTNVVLLYSPSLFCR